MGFGGSFWRIEEGLGMNVLIVDDSRGIRFRLRRYLEELGQTVVGEDSNGADALELVQQTQPELVTLDIVMPEMDGLTVLRHLVERHPDIKVVMITSAATLANTLDARAAGAKSFLVKPFDKEKVAQMLREVTGPNQKFKSVS